MTEENVCPTCDREDFKSDLGVKFHHKKVHGESLSKETFTCDYCNSEFTAPKHSRQEEHTFCDKNCSSKWHSNNISGDEHPDYERVRVNCSYCESVIYERPSRVQEYDKHFCDRECKGEWRSEHVKGKKHPRYNKEEYICDNCGQKFKEVPSHRSFENKFCSQNCQSEWQKTITGEDHPHYKGGHSKGFTESERKEIFDRDNYTCQKCGDKTEELNAHHITPVYEDNSKEHDIENGVTLCVECHAEKHEYPVSELILSQDLS
jgi:5-methylcytosine-specific restriction endonuclease McrA